MGDLLQVLSLFLWLDYAILFVQLVPLGLGTLKGFNEGPVQWPNADHDQVQNFRRASLVLLPLLCVPSLFLWIHLEIFDTFGQVINRIRCCRWCSCWGILLNQRIL